jgi:RNA-directed DNA polymerase
MGRKRRKIQKKMASVFADGVNSPEADKTGSGCTTTEQGPESTTRETQVMEEILERNNMRMALKRVLVNKGGPGVDGMTVNELPGFLRRHWTKIRAQLLDGSYRPSPLKRVNVPKPGGGVRKLGIPSVLDRLIQQACLRVLHRRWDRSFSEDSYGFRPGKSAHQAVERAKSHIQSGYDQVVEVDLERFFDRVNHDVLMARVAKRETDKRFLRLTRAYLNAGVMMNGVVQATEEGTPQGGPLSPILSNLLLDELDKELEKRGHRYVRYADDVSVYVRTERAGHRVLASVTRFLGKRLRLHVNQKKSGVVARRDTKLLGFGFTGGKTLKIRLGERSLVRFKHRIRKVTRRSGGKGLAEVIGELGVYLKGWRGYFGKVETRSVFRDLDSWIRRRLRSLIWTQLKRGRHRYGELRRRGIGKDLAAQTAGSQHGSWHLSRSPALGIAYPTSYFDKLGLPRLHVT